MNIEFYNIKDKKPKNKQRVVYIKTSKFYGSYEFTFAPVDYYWDNNKGCQVDYEEGDVAPGPKFKLFIAVGKEVFKENTEQDFLWADCQNIEKILNSL